MYQLGLQSNPGLTSDSSIISYSDSNCKIIVYSCSHTHTVDDIQLPISFLDPSNNRPYEENHVEPSNNNRRQRDDNRRKRDCDDDRQNPPLFDNDEDRIPQKDLGAKSTLIQHQFFLTFFFSFVFQLSQSYFLLLQVKEE